VKRISKLTVLFAATAAAAAGCGSAPVSSNSTTSASFTACMVTDIGGLNDHSFNEGSWQGMQDAASASKGKIQVKNATSATENDYTTNINGFIGGNCGLIVTVGYDMADATAAAAKKNPTQKFAIVDYGSTGTTIKGLQFDTAQGAFLGGYFAAAMTKTGKVATFGGQNIPTVTVYMDGFWEGVQYYNQTQNKNVQVLGWNETTQQGTFDSSDNQFADEQGGEQMTQTFAQQGADIVFPVAGGTGIGALAAARASNGAINVIWVDNDGYFSNQAYYQPYIMTSVVKGLSPAVETAVNDTYAGKFTATSYIGTLANNGTGLAPYHDWASKVPASLTSQLNTIKSDIENGTIKLKSKNQPTA
jgi:basic membrane protein A and related proteins